MNRFKILVGRHIQDGKTYEKGKIVTSALELDKVFPGKFQKLAPKPAKEAAEKGA